MNSEEPIIRNGWRLLFHPLFLDQFQSLVEQVERLKVKNPATYRQRKPTKRLAAIYNLVFDRIPQNPGDTQYRLGNTLGKENRHWFRAKFFQQYRLFFRFDSRQKVLIFAWVNDEKCLRAYDSPDDAYAVFGGMLERGNPPSTWLELYESASPESPLFDRLILAGQGDQAAGAADE